MCELTSCLLPGLFCTWSHKPMQAQMLGNPLDQKWPTQVLVFVFNLIVINCTINNVIDWSIQCWVTTKASRLQLPRTWVSHRCTRWSLQTINGLLPLYRIMNVKHWKPFAIVGHLSCKFEIRNTGLRSATLALENAGNIKQAISAQLCSPFTCHWSASSA